MSSPTATATSTALIPGLPDDISAEILLSLPLPHQLRLRRTSRRWSLLLPSSPSLSLSSSPPLLLALFPSPSLAPPLLLCPLSLASLSLPPLPPSPFSFHLDRFSALSLGLGLVVVGGSAFDARAFPLEAPSAVASGLRFDLGLYLSPPRQAGISGAGFQSVGVKWERIADMNSARGSFACARTRSGDIVVAGGGSRHSVFPSHGSRISSAERYDSKTGKWENLERLPKHRAGCVGFTRVRTGPTGTDQEEEEEFWVMGGYGDSTTVNGVVPADVYYKDAVVLGLRTGTWRSVPDMWDEGERARLGPIAVVERRDGTAKEVFMLDDNRIFRYDFDSNRWLKEATLRKKVRDNESCGFVSMNGEIYVLTSAIKSDSSDFKRTYRRRPVLEMQVFNPKIKKWRFCVAHPPISQPIDFKASILCPIRI